MSCYRPLPSKLVKHEYTGQNVVFLSKADLNYDYHLDNVNWLPCGNCLSCKLKYSRVWAERLQLEAKSWRHNYFLTLTYDNQNLPFSLMNKPTLRKVDIQSFMKRLRLHFKRKFKHEPIRFFGAGEYGSKTQRPHYHYILFNLPLNDLEIWSYNGLKQPLYNSPLINRVWSKGHVVIGELSWESASYVARYSLKKVFNEKDINDDREPEFVLSSRRPGIGKKYFDENKEKIYKRDYVLIKRESGFYKAKPSRYFDKLLAKEDEKLLANVKERRKQQGRLAWSEESRKTDKGNKSYLLTKEENKLSKLTFKREL